MNYVKELHAFKNWLLTNHLPSSAILLWYTLMAINNGVGWKRNFNAPNLVVEHLSGLSKQGVAKARVKLLDHQLIVYQPGRVGKAPIYQMISLTNKSRLEIEENQLVDESVDQVGDQWTDRFVDQLGDQTKIVDQLGDDQGDQAGIVDQLDDQLKTKSLTIPKQREEEERRGRSSEENPLISYEQNFGEAKPMIRQLLREWCLELGDDIVLAAIKLAIQKGGQTYSYLEKILKQWTSAELKTIEQVHDYLNEKQSKQQSYQNTIPFRTRAVNETEKLFEELRREGSS